MKARSSIVRMALTAITSTVIGLGSPWSTASAQNEAPPPANTAPTAPVNPSGIYPGPGTRAIQAPPLPYGAGEVVKMYQGGINKDVIVNYIETSSLPYRLNADGIIYLQTLGVPQEITKAMLQRDGQLQQERQQPNQQYYQPQPMPQPMPQGTQYPYGAMGNQQQPVQVYTPSTPAPPVTDVGPDYPDYGDYGYAYPSYPYYPYYYAGWPYYYYGGGLYGRGWGWGWGHGGFRGGFGGFRGGPGFGGFRGGVGFGGFHGGGGFGGFHAGGGGGFHGGSAGGHGGGGGGHR